MLLLTPAALLFISFSNVELPATFYPVNDGTNKPIGEITRSIQIGQTFVAEHSNLNRIDILFATYGRKNTEDIIFHLSEKLIPEKDIVTFTYKFNAKSVENNKYFSITFPEIPDSEGETYYFYIESPESKEGNAITIWYLPNNSYAQGTLYINDNVSGGDLLFRPYYKSNLKQYLYILLDRLQTNKPWFYNKYTFIILFIMYFSSLALAALFIINLRDFQGAR